MIGSGFRLEQGEHTLLLHQATAGVASLGVGLEVTFGLRLGLWVNMLTLHQATAGVASRAWVLPLHSLLAPEAQLKVLGMI